MDQDTKLGESIDPFHYLKTDEFTSEIYKIEIYNLPRKFGFAQLKKRLNGTLGLKCHKINNPQAKAAFVTFRCEEDREEALKKINEHVWKGQKLSAKVAKPRADPLLRKRKQEKDVYHRLFYFRIKNSVTPYWNVDYEEQLKRKTQSIVDVLISVAKRPDVKQLFVNQRKKYNEMCCELLPIIPSPVIEKYRNKCEFSIGKNVEGKDNCVGFRYGLYKDGFSTVGDISDIAFLPDSLKSVAKSFEEFLSTSPYKSYHQGTHEGHWRQLTVRATRAGSIMIIPEFYTKNISQEDLEIEKKRLVEFYTVGEGKTQNINSLYFTPFQSGEGQHIKTYEHLFGDQTIKEQMLNMTFQISPDAFFQVNTSAAEVLYNKIGEWCNIKPDVKTTVLDICCGTGTIGLALAKKVTKVIGVEMCQQAIDDAKQNAKLNEIKNVEYYCSRAEEAIVTIIKTIWTPNVVAVVDPPRAGLHKTVLRSLRVCRRIKRLIYVSCSPQSAKDNFIDLVRPPTKKLKGQPYKLIKAVPVDLFPMTPHCELLLLFERDLSQTNDSSGSDFEMTSAESKTDSSKKADASNPSAEITKKDNSSVQSVPANIDDKTENVKSKLEDAEPIKNDSKPTA
ncbi:hypothetical protein LOTGIDRAFT_121926 [Lottia gigantea]|uniref:tRNA (uracil(54)-C(5))-methyltransferase n=1 Tax=Lottia gigantea TaxID=225164 RepID=V4AE71_LOTGI|nr:hypothetical protein LOTGIDRAFT_121926 [Lottia gigantea]ESO91641.1 hypothetical protein LOTGIDRAFT_121926 [Lottia gigantea]